MFIRMGLRRRCRFRCYRLVAPAPSIELTTGPIGDEVCDDLDNDLDGRVDEGFFDKGARCVTGAGVCAARGRMVCDAAGGLSCDATPGAPTAEVCDGEDGDCDGFVDEGTAPAGACAVGGGRGDVICDGARGLMCVGAQAADAEVWLAR